MSDRYHSRTYAALRAVAGELSNLTFPPLNGVVPKVIFGDPWGAQDRREQIGVKMRVQDSDITWERMGPAGRDEMFTIDVVIMTSLPGRNGDQVLDRLEELSQLVEGVLYDVTSKESTPLDLPGVTNLSMVSSVSPNIGQADEGFVGESTISLMIRSRI
jgi:hypothetical protein